MKKILLSVTAALMAVIMLASCSSGTQKDGSASDGTTASSSDKSTSSNSASAGILANFSATDLNGNTVDQTALADYKLTMVNVWATFCTPCLNEMPELGELADEYSGKGVQIVGLVAILLVQGVRKVPVQYAKRIVGNKQYGGARQYIPLKVNAANVMPIIFAQAIMFIPITFIGFSNTESASGLMRSLIDHTSFAYNLIFAILIIVFT